MFAATAIDTSRPVAGFNPTVGAGAVPLAGRLADGARPPRPLLSFDRGTAILREGSPALHWYEVVAGIARTCKLLADGRRLIGEFLMPGDRFGFELEATHTVEVEAIAPTAVVRFPVARSCDHYDGFDSAAARLHRLAFETVARNNARLLLLARQTAQERVASFILEMDRRLERKGPRLELPMTRQDVADYLCLTIETVCRTLGELRRTGIVAVDAQHAILIRDRAELEAVAGL